jgi:hypothetical protein
MLTTPPENRSAVKAPVLFRLPHLQRAAAVNAPVAAGGYSGDRGDVVTSQPNVGPVAASAQRGTAFIDPSLASEEHADVTTPIKSNAAPAQPNQQPAATEESFMRRWGLEIKRSVILLAAIALLWGAWAMGQKSVIAPNESNLAEVDHGESANDSASVAAVPTTSAPSSVDTIAEPRVAHIVEPKLGTSAGLSGTFASVAEPASTFYTSDDIAAAATAMPAANPEIESDFSQFSPDALQPPGNSEFYGDYDITEPANASAQKPPMMSEAADSNQTALNQPTAEPAIETALPTATNFVPSATPEMPGFDPNSIRNVDDTKPRNRPVLSSTPNGIIDWSRYLPGAAGTAAIRAVSATQAIGEAADETQAADSQAIYLDKNEPSAPNVGVAPFYR